MLIKRSEIQGDLMVNLQTSLIETLLGPILAIADDQALYLLEFRDGKSIEKKVEQLKKKLKCTISSGKPNPIWQIESELGDYFSSKTSEFKTPLFLLGSPFQKKVWEELKKIPRGETRSYAEIAKVIGNPSGFRAVALANGANRFPIVIPCHRVIYSNGTLGGYSGGINYKKWLLNHERN